MEIDKLSRLRNKNSNIKIFHCEDTEFQEYGKIISDYNFVPYIEYASGAEEPDQGVQYIPGIEELEKMSVTEQLCKNIYRNSPIQVGWVRGYNNQLNALEYHHASEVNIGVTDSLLLLGKTNKIKNNYYSNDDILGFFLPGGIAVELFSTTLHFAPIQTDDEPFCVIVVLPLETNYPLEEEIMSDATGEDRLLFMKYKWLIAHKDSPQVEKGAFCGLKGDKIVIDYK